ncbi:unnamed protein product [Calypogeia fissa]
MSLVFLDEFYFYLSQCFDLTEEYRTGGGGKLYGKPQGYRDARHLLSTISCVVCVILRGLLLFSVCDRDAQILSTLIGISVTVISCEIGCK